MKLGEVFPDFTADSTTGQLKWHEFIEGSWAVLFSHPADYTPVCTTELGSVAKLMPEFEKRGVKVAALSCDTVESHKGWVRDIEATKFAGGHKVHYPIIADADRSLAIKFGMLDANEKNSAGQPVSCRAVFVIGPDKKMKLSILYPATTGRDFHEILRAIDSLQLTVRHSVATPANWTHGKKCMIVPSLSDDEALRKLGGFETVKVPSNKSYIRMVEDPTLFERKHAGQNWLFAPINLLGGGLKNVGNALADLGPGDAQRNTVKAMSGGLQRGEKAQFMGVEQ